MSKITMENGKLSAGDRPVIPFIEGDGVGAEITPASRQVVSEAIKKAYGGKRSIEWKEVLAGEKALRQTGNPLPAETIRAFEEYRVGLKGPLSTPVGEGLRSLNVALRQALDLYVCLRPVRWFKGVSSPLKEPERVNMHVFRENTEDIYAGIEWEEGSAGAAALLKFLTEEMGVTGIRFPETSAFGIKPVSAEGSRRLVRAAITYALQHGLPSVTLVHKGNIMKYTEGGFRQWGYEVATKEFAPHVFTMRQYDEIRKEYGGEAARLALEEAGAQNKVIINDVIADAFLQNTLLKPEAYSVIATLNLNGDYISDQLAAMVGGIGIAPGGNINYRTGHAVFEATHGTAPDIAGRNLANPSSLILSSVMMLEYLGWNEAARIIVRAMEETFLSGEATEDLARFMPAGRSLTTEAFANAVIHRIKKQP